MILVLFMDWFITFLLKSNINVSTPINTSASLLILLVKLAAL